MRNLFHNISDLFSFERMGGLNYQQLIFHIKTGEDNAIIPETDLVWYTRTIVELTPYSLVWHYVRTIGKTEYFTYQLIGK